MAKTKKGAADFRESVLWSGWVKIIIAGPYKQKVINLPNLITDAGLNLIRQALKDTAFDAEIKYVALGNSNIAPAAGDVKLGNEIFRKAVTKQEEPGTGQVKTICYIAPYECNQQIEEIGWFAGVGATGAKDSGVLVARVLWPHLKNELESLTIERTDTFVRV